MSESEWNGPVKMIDLNKETCPAALADLKAKIGREHRHFGDKPWPSRVILAWHAFLYGNLYGLAISMPDYDQLEAMLPPLPDEEPNPVQQIAAGREFDDDHLYDGDDDDAYPRT